MVVTDVTVRNRLERRVRESEERFRTLTEASAAIIWTTSPAGEFDGRSRNGARSPARAPAEAAGMGWIDAVHPEDRDGNEQAWLRGRRVRARYLWNTGCAGPTASGATWRAGRADPATRTATSREWVGTHTDITERKLAEERAARPPRTRPRRPTAPRARSSPT